MIRLISSLAYANVAQLGYDPNMELLWKNDKWNYWITIKGKDNHGNIVVKVYETIGIIADMSSNLRGRATRVYEAYDVESRATVVIKDSWVDANRPKEADVLSKILDGASKDEKALFLTVLLHGVVTIHDKEDLTQNLLMNGYLVTTDNNDDNDQPIIKRKKQYHDIFAEIRRAFDDIKIGRKDTVPSGPVHKASIFELLKVLKSDSQADSQSASLVTSPDMSILYLDNRTKRQPLVYGPKAHYRIVFKERGESLHRMSHQHDIELLPVTQAMYDILKGDITFISC